MGGRGAKAGVGSSAVARKLQTAKKNNQFPNAIAGDPKQQQDVLKAINNVYDYPADLKSYMSSEYRQGTKKVQIGKPQTDDRNAAREYVMIRAGNSTLRASYVPGASAKETAAIRDGAVKFALINWWRKQGNKLSFNE